jgi:hypothetical protein
LRVGLGLLVFLARVGALVADLAVVLDDLLEWDEERRVLAALSAGSHGVDHQSDVVLPGVDVERPALSEHLDLLVRNGELRVDDFDGVIAHDEVVVDVLRDARRCAVEGEGLGEREHHGLEAGLVRSESLHSSFLDVDELALESCEVEGVRADVVDERGHDRRLLL